MIGYRLYSRLTLRRARDLLNVAIWNLFIHVSVNIGRNLYCYSSIREEKTRNIPSLPAGSMIFIWWKLKMSYHTSYPNWDSWAVVCHLFLYSLICATTTAFTWLSKFCTLQLSSVFYLYWDLSWCRISFWKGDLQFSNCLKIQFV